MASIPGKFAPLNGSVYVCNLPYGTDENMLAEYFGTIGVIKKDKRTGRPKIWLYRDKETNEPKGDATVTYEDPHAAVAAVEWFNNKDFHGNTIGVYIAESKNKDDQAYNLVDDPVDAGNVVEPEETASDDNGVSGRGRGQNDASGKPWQQEGDWMCPNTSCSNVNFAFRGACNRCGSARPAGAGGVSGGGGRGRGRSGPDSGGAGRPVGGGLFGPNDWPCPMCGNINWAKRTKCNICNTNKPGHNEGGVRGGRAGGYKELDEEEIEETKRRRRQAEDDGELYDEFGNLKKKFRAKTQQAEVARVLPGSGRAGWEVEELGNAATCELVKLYNPLPPHTKGIDRDATEKSRDRGRERDDGENRNRERNEKERQSSRNRERDRGRDRDWDYVDRDRDYGRDRDRNRHRY